MNVDIERYMKWHPVKTPPIPNLPILMRFENREFSAIGYYDDISKKYIVRNSEGKEDMCADRLGKVNGWLPLFDCLYLTGVISRIDLDYGIVDIVVCKEGRMKRIFVKPDMIGELGEGDTVLVTLVNGIPTECDRCDV